METRRNFKPDLILVVLSRRIQGVVVVVERGGALEVWGCLGGIPSVGRYAG